ncbi:hypothetical protein CS542_05650 [Pedobacter sp. IW39]|nr:hypothetical protein CS542_05650 [Pedobacter sp. IW39]
MKQFTSAVALTFNKKHHHPQITTAIIVWRSTKVLKLRPGGGCIVMSDYEGWIDFKQLAIPETILKPVNNVCFSTGSS